MRSPILSRQFLVCSSCSCTLSPLSGLSSCFSAFFTGLILSLHCNSPTQQHEPLQKEFSCHTHSQESRKHTPLVLRVSIEWATPVEWNKCRYVEILRYKCRHHIWDYVRTFDTWLSLSACSVSSSARGLWPLRRSNVKQYYRHNLKTMITKFLNNEKTKTLSSANFLS